MAVSRDGTVAFTINDIDLQIAPESISVQMEDLVYTWKTLRTKASTKIPSGHGQTLVQVRIPFMDSDILALHRLIVEFRHSPFCYIENLYLRQSLCPEWPLGQKMAFTMTGLDIVPYPGTTNAWIVNLEMTWFNYFPYVHNWLYRRDWTTEWVSHKGDKAEPYYVKMTIGWDIDDDGKKKGPRLNIIEEKSALDDDRVQHQEWSALNESYLGKELTIQDMELLHRGEIFDLLPMPSQMEKAFFVPQPSESLIYKRYINFLQRDALKKNFDIDLEKIIGYEPGKPNLFYNLLFGKFILHDGDEVTDFVQSIHDIALPQALAYPQLQAEWNTIQNRLIDPDLNGILYYKQGVEFSFATYKSVQLPNQVALATQKILETAKKNAVPASKTATKDDTSTWIYADDNSLKIRVRRGLSEPLGFHSPLGWMDEDVRTFETLSNARHDFMHWRSAETLSKIYTRKEKEGRFHWGMDIGDGCKEGETAVFAVKDGYARIVNDPDSKTAGVLNRWKTLTRVNGVWERSPTVGEVGSELYNDWLATTIEYLGEGKYQSANTGTVLSSLANPDRLFYVDFGDGGQSITLSHNDDRERSKYLHLSKIVVEQGAPVKAGELIGYVGKTSTFKTESVVDAVTDGEGNIYSLSEPVDIDVLDSDVAVHLHFEYYERKDWHPERDANSTDDVKIKEPTFEPQYVAVDVRPTWEWAASQGYTDLITDNPPAKDLTVEVAKEAVATDPNLTADDKAALVAALDFMYDQGYFYYDRQSDITNVWWRPWKISVETVNPEYSEYDDVIRTDTAVLTNMTGGLRHIVANIPILGHEFPTQQHLGSVEPYYNLEFHLLDDSGTLEGIGERGGVLSALRFLLQHNARKFRLIPDSWCLLTDAFLTRLIGTFQVSDLSVAKSIEDSEVITDFVLNRRTMIARAQQDTVEGNPGLSRLLWELQETNPYTSEALEINAPSLYSMEEAREKILKSLFEMDFISDYKNLALKLLIAQAAGANTTDPQAKDFGQFTLGHTVGMGFDSVAYTNDYSQFAVRRAWQEVVGSQNTAARVQHGEEVSDQVFLLKDPYQMLGQSLRAQGIPVVSFNGNDPNIPPEKNIERGTDKDYIAAISAEQIGLDKYQTKTYTGPLGGAYTVYDISGLLKESQNNLLLGEIPIGKISTMMMILRNILVSAEMYLAEDGSLLQSGSYTGTALTAKQITEDLYNLPVTPRLFRTFQNYILNTAAYFHYPELTAVGFGIGADTISASPAKALSQRSQVELAFDKNANWLVWNTAAKLTEADLRAEVSWFTIIALAFEASTLGVGTVIVDTFGRAKMGFENAGRSFVALMNGSTPDLESYWAATYNEQYYTVNNAIAKGYVRALPLIALSASEAVKDIIEDSVFGDLVGGIAGDSGLPAIANTQTRLASALLTSGHFGPHPWFGDGVPFFLENMPKEGQEFQDIDLSVDSAGNLIIPEVQGAGQTYKTKSVSYAQAVLEVAGPVPGLIATDVFHTNEELFEQAGIPFPGSAMVWDVDTLVEREKVRYFKQLLARLADSCLAEPGVLKAFGLEGLAGINRSEISKGKEAYPDLDLPYHPYYGTTFATYPDFYMWNMYEDGDVFNSNVRKEVSAGMNSILTNAYKSLHKLQSDDETGSKAYKPSRDTAVQDPNIDDNVVLNIKYNAEGTDGMATPFYPTDSSKGAIEDFYKGIATKAGTSKASAADYATSDSETGVDSSTVDNVAYDSGVVEQLSSVKPLGIRVENGAGFYGMGAGVQYPTRLSAGQYEQLKGDVDKVTSMFGSRAGYAKEKGGKTELTEEIESRLDGTPLRRQMQPSHKFDLESLKLLAENCSNDLFSQKRRMARAFPTFKLYFIEEDEWENRLLNFDDFYSYNAVKDFTVTMSRKTPGDVAVVTLQNVSGILDGTKRDAVVDLDYFGTTMKAKAVGADSVTKGTQADQPFGSLVLRPGLNVQLRAGYSNDPDNLNVMINGRVVDVQWNQVGDTAQIMIQSFGTELLQVLKGTTPDSSEIYYTTHQLLGSLMLEPELQHFGRWEIGQMFQTHEGNDYRFDFNDYSKEAHFGRFEYSSKAVKWFFNHPVILYGIAIGGLGAASRIPGVGRLFSKVSRWGTRIGFVEKIAMRLGVVGRVGEEVFEKELIAGATRAATRRLAIIEAKAGSVTAQQSVALAAERQALKNTVIAGESAIDLKIAQEIIDREVAVMARRASIIGTRDAGAAFGTNIEAMIKARGAEISRRLLQNGAGLVPQAGGISGKVVIKDAAAALRELDGDVATALLKGGWMSNPMGTATGMEMIKDIGRRPLSNLLTGSFTGVSKVLGTAAATGLVLDAATWTGIPQDIYEATLGRAKKYFAAAQISIMLSPQDDNLFPPHPKDYMLTNMPWSHDAKVYLAEKGTAILSTSESLGKLVGHYFADEAPYDKRVPVSTCQYQISNSYIWDIFNEMALRHPGWIFAIRPYGKKFRYTMFFGVPSQRYWAAPADNLFIARANKVQRMIENDVSMDEYRNLYGDTINGWDLQVWDDQLQNEADTTTISTAEYAKGLAVFKANSKVGQGNNSIYQKTVSVPLQIRSRAGTSYTNEDFLRTYDTAEEGRNALYQDKLASLRRAVYTAKALDEYLHALSLRFIPFRRYHSISSEVDLVWNGIIGSENAAYNAVDVTYFDEDVDKAAEGPEGSALVKAHAFLPESKLRVKPMPPFINCRGYDMAMRYGMAELAFSLREMYRGEIITLGNSRIMPWDIVILQDTYNSMVGPIEVEQVVHNFSHETGFITEIKPGAVVLVNETSSWPLLEAMKLASLAVRNIQEDALGMTADSFGSALGVAEWIADTGPGGNNPQYQDHAKNKMKEIFGENWDARNGKFIPGRDLTKALFGDMPPNAAGVEEVNEFVDKAGDTISAVADGLAVIGGVASVGLGLLAWRYKLPFGTKLAVAPGALAKTGMGIDKAVATGGLLASGLVLASDAMLDPPQLMSLLGGNLLMLQCLKGDSVMVVPLMKNGYPVVAGLNYHDPAMIWKNFLGDLGRFADDVIGGTRDLADLWQIYGMYAWRRLPEWDKIKTDQDGLLTGVNTTGGQ